MSEKYLHGAYGVTRDSDGCFCYKGARVYNNEPGDEKWEKITAHYVSSICKGAEDVGLTISPLIMKRSLWINNVDNMMDDRLYYMLHMSDFYIKDNRYLLFPLCENPFIWDSKKREKINVYSTSNSCNLEGWTRFSSFLYGSESDKVDIEDISWNIINGCINYFGIYGNKIFDDDFENTRKPIFDTLSTDTAIVNEEEDTYLTMESNDNNGDAIVNSIEYSFKETSGVMVLVIHSVECSRGGLLYRVPGILIENKVTNKDLEVLPVRGGERCVYSPGLKEGSCVLSDIF